MKDVDICKYCSEMEDLPEHITTDFVGKVFDTSIDYDKNGYHICLPSGADIGIKYCPYCGRDLNAVWRSLYGIEDGR